MLRGSRSSRSDDEPATLHPGRQAGDDDWPTVGHQANRCNMTDDFFPACPGCRHGILPTFACGISCPTPGHPHSRRARNCRHHVGLADGMFVASAASVRCRLLVLVVGFLAAPAANAELAVGERALTLRD